MEIIPSAPHPHVECKSKVGSTRIEYWEGDPYPDFVGEGTGDQHAINAAICAAKKGSYDGSDCVGMDDAATGTVSIFLLRGKTTAGATLDVGQPPGIVHLWVLERFAPVISRQVGTWREGYLYLLCLAFSLSPALHICYRLGNPATIPGRRTAILIFPRTFSVVAPPRRRVRTSVPNR